MTSDPLNTARRLAIDAMTLVEQAVAAGAGPKARAARELLWLAVIAVREAMREQEGLGEVDP